ncbi:calcium-binding protein [Parasedimentitalea psychrophila]|uniref:Calcium-binding protein n=1 Tax=Parasedimentitalea psychrophila TaxID=2997337 RepID=A0A9Y2KZF4_9RHOB|nr:hypothetical protein [Parasedimentitalea psychrophila]WIY25358.1 hypothetical protein QPJ95_23275 [Parasedimentitalea psychrophila]
MTTNTIEAFAVGSFADIDPDETNSTVENTIFIVGKSFGSSSDPLHDSIGALTLDDANDDGRVGEGDAGYSVEDLWYNGSASELDAVVEYSVTVTYSDGTTGDDTIESNHVDADGTRVDGTDGANNTILGYAGNDAIDAGRGDDVVDAGIGDDTVQGGMGDDTIDGGEGNDFIQGGDSDDEMTGDTPLAAGEAEYLVQGFVKGDNFTLNNDHFNSAGATEFTVDGDPVQIRFIDNDANMDGDGYGDEIPTDMDGQVEINGELSQWRNSHSEKGSPQSD